MRSITNSSNALGGSLLKVTLQRINCWLVLMLCVIGISLTVTASPSNLDPTFGNGGKVVSSPDGSQALHGSAIALQSDGKIVMVGGRASAFVSSVVARYNSDGSLDMTFGNNGWNSTTFAGSFEFPRSVAIQTDGKIVVGGDVFTNVPTDQCSGECRLTSQQKTRSFLNFW